MQRVNFLEATIFIFGTIGDDDLMGTLADELIFGFAGNDVLTGGGGADSLEGGAGIDIMRGGLGDDTYFVGEIGDTVLELADQGRDIVYTSIDYTLPENIEVGIVASNGIATGLIGNELDNILIATEAITGSYLSGGAGNDTLYGLDNVDTIGGAGNDILVIRGTGNDAFGGFGDDTYIIAQGNPQIQEDIGGGMDTVYSYRTETLIPLSVEVLILVNGDPLLTYSGVGRFGNDIIHGNESPNILTGAGGNDHLFGGKGDDFLAGGAGSDVLEGHSGADVFYYDLPLDFGDIIRDWISGDDSFAFQAAAFGFSIGETLVNGNNFIAGIDPIAAMAVATFLWDSDDTALYFDADGSGAGLAVQVADLQAFTDVNTADFLFT